MSLKELARQVSSVVTQKVDHDRYDAFRRVANEGHGEGCGCNGCQHRAVNDANYWLDDEVEVLGLPDRGYRFVVTPDGKVRRRVNQNDEGDATS